MVATAPVMLKRSNGGDIDDSARQLLLDEFACHFAGQYPRSYSVRIEHCVGQFVRHFDSTFSVGNAGVID